MADRVVPEDVKDVGCVMSVCVETDLMGSSIIVCNDGVYVVMRLRL